ncbi:MAG: DUF3467 domain-containing protein [Candidatus Thorarchaeota archaeon]
MAKKKAKKTSKKTVKAKVKRVTKTKDKPTQPIIKKEDTLAILAKEDKLAGNYCNVAMISHTEREFVLDFIFAIANQHTLTSRVITSPQHMKKIYEVLGGNIKQYEKRFGEIKV